MAEKIYPVASSDHVYYTSDIQNLNKTLIKNKKTIVPTPVTNENTIEVRPVLSASFNVSTSLVK